MFLNFRMNSNRRQLVAAGNFEVSDFALSKSITFYSLFIHFFG